MSVAQVWSDRFERWPAPAILAGTIGAGLVWGVLARGWMALISTDPEFTVSGSMFVVGAFTVAAMCQGAAFVARRGRSAALRGAGRVVGLVGMFPLFIGAGVTMVPTVVGGGLAVGQRRWPPLLRAVAALVAMAPIVAVATSLADDFGLGLRFVAGVAGVVILYAGVVVTVTASLGRPVGAPPLPRAVRIGVLVVVPAVLLVSTVGLAGLRR